MPNLLSSLLSRFQKKKSFTHFINKFLAVHSKGLLLVMLTFGLYLFSVFSKMFYRTSEGVFIGHPNAWSDWALHISITQIFASKLPTEWFLYHPYFAHGKLTYGFLSHLLTGLLVKLGISIETAFFIISILLTLIFLSGLYVLYSQLFHKKNEILLGIFIFFASSGIGIFRFLTDLKLTDILNPQQDFTRFPEYEWLAGNIPAAMLIPQRAFFIGVSIGVWILAILLFSLKNKQIMPQQKNKLLLLAGILAGILPIAHMHSFIVIVIVSGTMILLNLLFLYQRKPQSVIPFLKTFSWFVIPATVLSNVLFFSFIYGGIEIDSFMQVRLGWTNSEGIIGWLIMWLKLWGVFLPLVALIGYKLFKEERKKINSIFFFSFLGVFLLGNIIQFQPTAWDNTKLFSWVYLGLSIYVAWYLLKLYNKKVIYKLFAIFLIILLTASGIVELIRLQNFDDMTFRLNSAKEVTSAQKLQDLTATDAVFLTALEHNHPISVWAARPMFLGYLGWVRNFGFDHVPREQAAYDIYSGKPNADELIKKYEISYIYLSSREQRFYRSLNRQFLSQFPIAYSDETITVYDTRHLWQQ